VVLSACETGVGRVLAGEGVMSLGRAFLRAGAGGVVATRWPVGDPTVAFMQAFYAALAHGEAPADALTTAKRVLLRGRYSAPLYWAPFVLITDGV
jgi:CHAT domain-containing protein